MAIVTLSKALLCVMC